MKRAAIAAWLVSAGVALAAAPSPEATVLFMLYGYEAGQTSPIAVEALPNGRWGASLHVGPLNQYVEIEVIRKDDCVYTLNLYNRAQTLVESYAFDFAHVISYDAQTDVGQGPYGPGPIKQVRVLISGRQLYVDTTTDPGGQVRQTAYDSWSAPAFVPEDRLRRAYTYFKSKCSGLPY